MIDLGRKNQYVYCSAACQMVSTHKHDNTSSAAKGNFEKLKDQITEMGADGCEMGLEVVRGTCRGPNEPLCGLLGEPCCADAGDLRALEFCEDGTSCSSNFFMDPPAPDTCISCGGLGENPCIGTCFLTWLSNAARSQSGPRCINVVAVRIRNSSMPAPSIDASELTCFHHKRKLHWIYPLLTPVRGLPLYVPEVASPFHRPHIRKFTLRSRKER